MRSGRTRTREWLESAWWSFTEQLGETLTPAIFGQALVDLAGRPAAQAAGSFRLTVDGITPLV